MQEWLKTMLIAVSSAVSGMGLSTVLYFVLRKFIENKIDEFLKKVLKPKTEEVLPDRKLDRIENGVAEIKKEILEMRGKRK